MQTILQRSGKEKTVTIFLMPPDEKVWEERLRSRGTNTEEDIALRLNEGYREMEQRNLYDHVVVNDNLETAVDEVIGILKDTKVIG
ncbi:MAG: guanylate kinase, partial [Spirochaetia bacterium]|nr:guanylate kinase [Spirochaetia bacterium]